MAIVFGRLKLHLFYICTVLFFLFSCGLKYEPVQTPRDLIEKRQAAIMEQMKQDFSARGLGYKAVKFGQSVTVKPPSHYLLDSLYNQKYELEKKQKISKSLEQQILLQRNVVLQDTTPVYYIEKHIFSVEDQGKFTAFMADVSVNKKNELMTIDILDSDEIDQKLMKYYSSFMLRESFIYPDTYPDESELAFYDFYEEKLEQLDGDERTLFLNFVLRVMQIAYKGKNVDKAYLIKELVRFYAQGSSKNYIDERFNDMDEFYDEQNRISHYKINYTYSVKDDLGTYRRQNCELVLDEYLQLVELIPLEK